MLHQFSAKHLKALDPFASTLIRILYPIAAVFKKIQNRSKKNLSLQTLVIRPGGMGDLILFTLACKKLKIRLSQFYFLIESRSEPWAKHLNLNYLCYNQATLWQLLKLKSKFQLALVTEQRFGLSALPALWSAQKIIGFSTNRCATLWDAVIPYSANTEHEVKEFSKLLNAHDFDKEKEIESLPSVQSFQETHPAESWLGVGIGGRGTKTRDFSLETWSQWILSWSKNHPKLWIAGSPEDHEWIKQLVKNLEKQSRQQKFLAFTESFSTLCEKISKAKAILTIDSGFLHLTSFYDIPTTAIFTSSIAEKWAPLAKGSQIVKTTGLSCQPCARFAQLPRCTNQYRCKLITIEQVSGAFPEQTTPE